MNNIIKTKLSIYGILSCLSFIYLIMTADPGIGVPIFIIIQFISMYYVIGNIKEVKNKKGMAMFIPIFILALNYFISGSNMFRALNIIAIIALYSAGILIINNELWEDKIGFNFIFNILTNIFVPFKNFLVPFEWVKIGNSDEFVQKYKIKQILLGLLLSVPCVIFLVIMLSSADLIFFEQINSFLTMFYIPINEEFLFKMIFGIFVGLYLFALLYTVFPSYKEGSLNETTNTAKNPTPKKQIEGDVIVINILLFSVLAVYTIFIAIQFKYLFAGSQLPYGLNYSEYARRGFFELVFLSVLNIGLILITVFLMRNKIYKEKTRYSQITKIFLLYLCLVTIVMLISSFYRMMLYNNEYGFTRLRVLVFLFLLFEAIGLLATFKFIVKPNFNVIAIYMLMGLVYYLTLNVIQIDNIIAHRNIDMYFKKETQEVDIDYLLNLSSDAAPQIKRLVDSENIDFLTKYKIKAYFEKISYEVTISESSWQNYNLSIKKAKEILQSK